MAAEKLDIAELELAELEAALSPLGVERFRAGQMYRWVYRRGLERFDGMTDCRSGCAGSSRRC